MSRRIHLVAMVVPQLWALAVRAEELTPPEPRQGYYVGVSALGAAARCHDKDLGQLGGSLLGGALVLRGGQMATSRLGFGVAFDASFTQASRWQQQSAAFLVETEIVLWRTLAIHGGAGLGFGKAMDKEDIVDETVGGGGGVFALGLTYDLFPWQARKSGGLAIRPELAVRVMPGDYNSRMLWAGLSTTWWSGLDKDELLLPPEEAFARKAGDTH